MVEESLMATRDTPTSKAPDVPFPGPSLVQAYMQSSWKAFMELTLFPSRSVG